MTVKEIILSAATVLGIEEEVKAYVNGESTDGQKTELLLHCFNIVENELALDYLPLYAEDEMISETGAIEFSRLAKPVVRILRVTDEWGNSVKFKLFPDYVKTQAGKVKITYTYTPDKKNVDGVSDYVLQASVRLFTYGVAAEYATASCLFEDAAVWDKKYKEAIAAAYHAKPCERMRSRRWA